MNKSTNQSVHHYFFDESSTDAEIRACNPNLTAGPIRRNRQFWVVCWLHGKPVRMSEATFGMRLRQYGRELPPMKPLETDRLKPRLILKKHVPMELIRALQEANRR